MTQTNTTSCRRVAVIGAGISGLAAAHRLLECGEEHVELFDAGSRAGGLLATERRGDYLIERGADAFVTNKPAAVNLCHRLSLEDQLIPTDATFRRSLVLLDGRPVPVPDGFQLLMPTKLDALMASPILTDEGKRRAAAEVNIPPAPVLRDESLASFVRRRFGDELFERLAQPMVGGIYTADPEKLSLLATLPRFLEMEQNHGSLLNAASHTEPEQASGARYGLFVSLKEGIGQLVSTLFDRVAARALVRTGCPVNEVRRSDSGGWSLHFNGDQTAAFDAVILAVPAWQGAQLLGSAAPDLAGALASIEYASSAIVCTTHSLADIEHPMDAFGLVIPARERRSILAVSFASRKFPGRAPEGSIVLRTFLGGAMQPEVLAMSDGELGQIVRTELAEIFGVRSEPQHELVTRYDQAMPQYHLGHLELVSGIRELVAAEPGLELAGNAFDGVGIPDSISSGEQAAERISGASGGAA